MFIYKVQKLFILRHSPQTAQAVVVPAVVDLATAHLPLDLVEVPIEVGSQLAMTAEKLTWSVVRMALGNQLMSVASAGHAGSASPMVQTVVATGDGQLTFD